MTIRTILSRCWVGLWPARVQQWVPIFIALAGFGLEGGHRSSGFPDTMSTNGWIAIVMAAGRGIRMKSSLPKPLHQVAGLPLVAHTVRAAAAVAPEQLSWLLRPSRKN